MLISCSSEQQHTQKSEYQPHSFHNCFVFVPFSTWVWCSSDTMTQQYVWRTTMFVVFFVLFMSLWMCCRGSFGTMTLTYLFSVATLKGREAEMTQVLQMQRQRTGREKQKVLEKTVALGGDTKLLAWLSGSHWFHTGCLHTSCKTWDGTVTASSWCLCLNPLSYFKLEQTK